MMMGGAPMRAAIIALRFCPDDSSSIRASSDPESRSPSMRTGRIDSDARTMAEVSGIC
jgi:hypothetical protein